MREELEYGGDEGQELLAVEERKDPFCQCEDFGEDSCPIHSQKDLEIIDNETAQELTTE